MGRGLKNSKQEISFLSFVFRIFLPTVLRERDYHLRFKFRSLAYNDNKNKKTKKKKSGVGQGKED